MFTKGEQRGNVNRKEGGEMRLDITGMVMGRLTAVSLSPRSNKQASYWVCLCSCGNTTTVHLTSFRSGHTQSCGCLWKEAIIKHGGYKHPLYSTWEGMRNRCLSKTSDSYPRYGGRGITICDEWLESFQNFYNDMGDKPTPKHSLDRIDNNKGYSKDNCQWVTQVDQMSNTRNSIPVVVNGIRYRTLKEAATASGFSYRGFQYRFKHGINLDQAKREW